ncbi:hypothetical protein NEMBOFW57_009623 [Staphylotrichum longicolle]|uniref:Peptidase S8/S53 domain-containing protein n=1 Tax=Staphylotrichum longicolle TaxID=669026 RepID=A0AAD4EPS2_9PEZI|nr:hypothetical protein NEMBOFW57_009623 [Staphylotrichum longicolle]
MSSFIGFPLALGAAPIKNDGLLADLLIPDTYIVKYKPNVGSIRRKSHEEDIDGKARNASRKGIFDKFTIPGLQGYVAEIPPSELILLTDCDLIDYIERDTIIKSTAIANPHSKRTMVTQSHAPWGLARISHRARNHPDTYYYSDTAGHDTRIYVLDTGIRLSHAEFAPSRAVWGANFVASSPDTDEDGHGTHVAGIISGGTYGVAKKATVVAVKVLDKTGTGSMSGLLRGLNWAVDDAKRRGVVRKAVVNMSLTGAYTESVNDGVQAATDAGMTVVAAAGNDGGDVAEWSPASAASAVTVGAMDRQDTRAEFSNWGSGMDVFAPGVGVESASNETDKATSALSGTSVAAPHVAGLAAYFIAREGLSGSEVKKRLLSAANKGMRDRKGSADRIAYNAGGA